MPLADAVSVGLFTCCEDRITWANDALADLVGARSGCELLGRSPGSFVLDGGRGQPDWPGGELNRSVGAALECELVRVDGEHRRIRVRPLGRGSYEVMDLSIAVAAPPAARAADPAEVDALRREVARLRKQQDRASRERDDLVAALGHELQTPLTVVSGFVRLLLSEQPGALVDEQRRFLRQAGRACERLSKLVDDLVSAQSGNVSEDEAARALDLRPRPLTPLLQEIAADFEAIAQTSGQMLLLDLAEDAAVAHFDPIPLTRVVTNLLANAFTHGASGQRVSLRTRRADGRVEISVDDEGDGVPGDEQDRIFEPYVRGRAARPGKGLGLGLAICRRIVEAHGGVSACAAHRKGARASCSP